MYVLSMIVNGMESKYVHSDQFQWMRSISFTACNRNDLYLSFNVRWLDRFVEMYKFRTLILYVSVFFF